MYRIGEIQPVMIGGRNCWNFLCLFLGPSGFLLYFLTLTFNSQHVSNELMIRGDMITIPTGIHKVFISTNMTVELLFLLFRSPLKAPHPA